MSFNCFWNSYDPVTEFDGGSVCRCEKMRGGNGKADSLQCRIPTTVLEATRCCSSQLFDKVAK